MAKYKVLKKFRDIHNNELYKANSEIELTEERAAEVTENLKSKGTFIELVKTPEEPENSEFDREETKEKLKELGVEFNGNAKNDTLKKLLEENEQTEKEENVEDGE